MSEPVVRVAIIDDHRLLAQSLSAALRADGYSVAVPVLTNPEELTGWLTTEPPDVALLDLDLGGFGTGLAVLPVLLSLHSRVIMVSGMADEAVIGRCLDEGAWGWIAKSAPIDALLAAIRAASAGTQFIDGSERDRLLRAWRERRRAAREALAPFDRLSRREAAVLAQLQSGRPVQVIAAELYLSEATVRSHVQAILRKLEVNSQLEAVAKASRAGWNWE